MMDQLFEEVAGLCREREFLETVCRKAHYELQDIELLGTVLDAVLESMGNASFSERNTDQTDIKAVVMTLGSGVDALQEEYLKKGELSEAYMVEVLGSEILLRAYGAYNRWVAKQTDFVVERYFFLGDPDRAEYSLEKLPGVLRESGLQVSCTQGYCMVPKKSVAFFAKMSPDRKVICEGICVGCGRQDCPNRMEKNMQERGNSMLDRPLTYGYARIFGL